ncbi:root meristem growth factor 8, GOLVEN 6 [Hibiscus trionum]|uniref:Root meristem growth factor 8, GOLVEN 6 n=1 Tax=Hibiscus trionum TaxID=183268 RepID=A0A9W7JIJ3_HIBTR|nr:root meristem growth factor 8, GOLVEN 6 [Hibiscus trionum]
MELKGIFITVLCFSFFALQTPCISLQIQSQPANEQGNTTKALCSSPLLVPRKLRFTQGVAVAQHSISSTEKKGDVSGTGKQKEQGRRQQWVEGDYFTMDYSGVRRRRPIHNKSMPVGP